MGTRSRIGIENQDGTITSVYCHWDGYPSYNGRMLLENYNTEEKIRELLSYGDMSSLSVHIGVQHPFDPPFSVGTPEHKEFRKMCTFYGRDRGEENVDARVHPTINDFMYHGEEYNYLFKDGAWRMHYDSDEWVALTEENTRTPR
jgi:hypothetical protein